jgi:molybdopterin-containing oxidoreductase family iron-sulfur binding subunit
VHRIDKDRIPACVEACTEKAGRGAMTFGDLNDPNSAIARDLSKRVTTRLRADLGLAPGVHYQGL